MAHTECFSILIPEAAEMGNRPLDFQRIRKKICATAWVLKLPAAHNRFCIALCHSPRITGNKFLTFGHPRIVLGYWKESHDGPWPGYFHPRIMNQPSPEPSESAGCSHLIMQAVHCPPSTSETRDPVAWAPAASPGNSPFLQHLGLQFQVTAPAAPRPAGCWCWLGTQAWEIKKVFIL